MFELNSFGNFAGCDAFVCLLACKSSGGVRATQPWRYTYQFRILFCGHKRVMLFVIFHKIDQEFNLLLVLKRNGEVT